VRYSVVVYVQYTIQYMRIVVHVVGSLENSALSHVHKTSRDWIQEKSAHAHKTSILYFRKELRQVGIAVYELGHVVGFQEKSAHGHAHKLSCSVFQEKTAISLA
jgi:hypothetical protein